MYKKTEIFKRTLSAINIKRAGQTLMDPTLMEYKTRRAVNSKIYNKIRTKANQNQSVASIQKRQTSNQKVVHWVRVNQDDIFNWV